MLSPPGPKPPDRSCPQPRGASQFVPWRNAGRRRVLSPHASSFSPHSPIHCVMRPCARHAKPRRPVCGLWLAALALCASRLNEFHMANKMLIDASHPEETRVVVLRGNRVEEFDFEAASKKQLRGNIYLAKVMRVEPSLQAAFVDYGGNRHGFLAFSEIHPDYYQIPVADRQALIDEEARAERDEEEDASRPQRRSRRYRRGDRNGQRAEKRRGADPTLSEAYSRRSRGRRKSCPPRGGKRRGGTGAVRRRTRRGGFRSRPARGIRRRACRKCHGGRRLHPGIRTAGARRRSAPR